MPLTAKTPCLFKTGIPFAILSKTDFMQKRVLGFVLLVIGLTGMGLSGYIFVTGTGGRGHLVEVTSYLIFGAACFFWGINYVYESLHSFNQNHLKGNAELDEVSPIQQQWRTIHVAKQPAVQKISTINTINAEATV